MADSDSEKEVVPENIPPYKVRFCDIDVKYVKEVVKFADQAFKNSQLEKDVAISIVNFVKSQPMFKIGDGQWQCIVGKNFGCSLTFDAHVLMFFDLLSIRKSVLLFKSG